MARQLPITFPKTSANVWTNRETGVIIVRRKADGTYRAHRPADVTRGYIGIMQSVRTLAEARAVAKRYVSDAARFEIARAYTEAQAENEEHDYWTARHAAVEADVILPQDIRDAGTDLGVSFSEGTVWLRAALRQIVNKAHAEALTEHENREYWLARHAAVDAGVILPQGIRYAGTGIEDGLSLAEGTAWLRTALRQRKDNAVARLVRDIESHYGHAIDDRDDFLSDPGGYIAYLELTEDDDLAAAAIEAIKAKVKDESVRIAHPVGIEAVCGTCGETFNPSDYDDTEHIATADGRPCGGIGQITGAW